MTTLSDTVCSTARATYMAAIEADHRDAGGFDAPRAQWYFDQAEKAFKAAVAHG